MAVTMGSIVVATITEVNKWPDRRVYQVVCLIVAATTMLATIIVSRRKTSEDWGWRP